MMTKMISNPLPKEMRPITDKEFEAKIKKNIIIMQQKGYSYFHIKKILKIIMKEYVGKKKEIIKEQIKKMWKEENKNFKND